ncbi:MAG: zinc-binding alcohol dehydrogenase family protein [Propionibacteriaceae bacterium]|nr:zinc-binding alcohol dehydrogenase family protein [Propionibacteriaceae bacterium]
MTTTTAIGYQHNLPVSDPASLTARTIELGSLGVHDLVVEIEAVSVNPVDVKLRAGAPAEGFRVLGFDAAGVVREVGEAVELFAPGDEVFYAGEINRPGSNQHLQLVDERIVGRKPRSLSFADAAALPLTVLTAWETLFEKFRLTGDSAGTLFVIGATGGVGAMLVQLAEAMLPDVTVIATASDPERAEWITGLGADYTVNHRDDLVAQVLALAPTGVDWLFTAHSEGQLPTYAEIVRTFGQITAIDDGPRDVAPLKGRSITWHWELMFTRSLHRTSDLIEQHRILERVASLVDDGKLITTATRAFTPISAATLREAHALVESGHTMGKVVLHGWE